eukprot:TRINITY_DN14290_c0_g1_i1.p1 TRINITY_DN14290_c0_g1~~TRINITY_DN14290_c0_g1_i1.p1  ORF type:complete len:386 (-),score=126.53 TRINITY_DN14290_c0_g1_i1:1176-2333(-)
MQKLGKFSFKKKYQHHKVEASSLTSLFYSEYIYLYNMLNNLTKLCIRNKTNLNKIFVNNFSSTSTVNGQCLILVDHDNKKISAATKSTITAANQITDQVDALVLGNNCSSVVDEIKTIKGISRVLVKEADFLEKPVAENISNAVLQCQNKNNYTHILSSASTTGKNTLPRVAAKLDVAGISDIIKVVDENVFVRPIYAGNAIQTVKSKDPVKIITVRSTAFEKQEDTSNNAEVVQLTEEITEGPTKWVKEEVGQLERPELTSANTVISGGKGMENGENFKMLEELADYFEGAVGASRAAVDAGFVPNDMQVGQTGKVVAPELYIAVGISGAIQHLAGMKDSKVIVAINKDEEAPIFQVSDYGLVGDLFKVVPELNEKIKKIKSSN